MRDIINKLRDDSEYYTGIGKFYLSNSDIGALLNNPKSFRAHREDSKHFQEGKLFHQLLIEPEKAKDALHVDVSTRNTKEYKKFIEDNGVEYALLTKEVREVEAMVNAMRSNIQFYDDIYMDGNKYEEPMIANIKGYEWKGKADIVTPNFIIDLKTTGDINKFRYTARSYNYDSQCYLYQELFGKPLYFYVIDKETHQLGIFKPEESFVKNGEYKVEAAIRVYEKYFGPHATEDIVNHFINETLS